VAGTGLVVVAWCPPELVMQPPLHRLAPEWLFALPIVVGRCALPREAVHRLAVRDVIVVGKELTLVIGDGGLPLVAAAGSVVATVATGYVRADMGLPDDAHLELTVQLGTTRLSLRRIGELAVGEVIALGRPLAGPYEIHVGGRAIGQGELVDIDGEVGVRIVSLSQE
jgi:type III secretion protein Q